MERTENLGLWLPADSDPIEVSKLSENFSELDSAIKTLGGGAKNIKCIAITASTTWTVPSNARDNKFQVLCQGGGGAGGKGGITNSGNTTSTYGSGAPGGVSGAAVLKTLTLTPGEQIPVTVGAAAGATSFGSYITAAAGTNGAVGKAGGGAAGASAASGAVTISGTSLGYIERALGMIVTPKSGTHNANGNVAGSGFNGLGGLKLNNLTTDNPGSGGGGSGGLDIGDGTRASSGSSGGSYSRTALGGTGGIGYGSGGGGGGGSTSQTASAGGAGAPGIILVAWEEA